MTWTALAILAMFVLEPARFLGACKPGLWACMDSTTGAASVPEIEKGVGKVG